eukprot:Awhi_evm1s11760
MNVCLFLLLLFGFVTICQAVCDLEVGTKYVGSWEVDYYWKVSAPTIESCNDLCHSNSECLYFTYDTVSNGRVCDLLPDVIERIADLDFTSGDACPPLCSHEVGISYTGSWEVGYYWKDSAPTIESCNDLCLQSADCKYFSYNTQSSERVCDLFADIIAKNKNPDFTSAEACTRPEDVVVEPLSFISIYPGTGCKSDSLDSLIGLLANNSRVVMNGCSGVFCTGSTLQNMK